MIDIVCAAIAAVATIMCAVVSADSKKRDKAFAEQRSKEDDRARQRAKEASLQLAMINANSELTVGVAWALKRGKCNGEVEQGLAAVKAAQAEYTKFLEGIAIDHITK